MSPSGDALRIKIDGIVYAVDPGEISRGLAIECLQDLGMSHEQVLAALHLQPGKLALHGFMWLARRLAGEPRYRREGRVTTHLAAEIWKELDAYEEIEMLGDEEPAGEEAAPVLPPV